MKNTATQLVTVFLSDSQIKRNKLKETDTVTYSLQSKHASDSMKIDGKIEPEMYIVKRGINHIVKCI